MITKEDIKNAGEFNNWKGYIGLYFTKKMIRTLKPFGITEDTTIEEAYKLIK